MFSSKLKFPIKDTNFKLDTIVTITTTPPGSHQNWRVLVQVSSTSTCRTTSHTGSCCTKPHTTMCGRHHGKPLMYMYP